MTKRATGMAETSPLLETKLYAPRPRTELVGRPQLIERLNRGVGSKLTLLSAPAGFGKTTLLAEWLASPSSAERSVGWFSVDEADDEPTTFWTYLISALQRAIPGIGADALSLMDVAHPSPFSEVLTAVLNELAAVPHEIVLVLDDYEAVAAPEIQEGMTFLLEHLPDQAHLVIATRADPALPLARMRARGELVEIRAADLRFNADAASAYLNGVMGLQLQAGDVAALEVRTEGWIAALQLAALSMQGRDDTASFIAEFAGDDRYIVDYLVEEVLQRQSEHVRNFLLRTSILERLYGPLCDAVTGQDDGTAMLDALDRGNLFLVSLDDRRHWYRYHHLFADVLRARLRSEQADHVHELHRRAGKWYEGNAELSEAVRHALAGEDFERAADLIELTLPSLRQARAVRTMRAWLQAIPEELFASRPVLNVAYAGVQMANGEVADVEARLREAERWLDLARDAQSAGGAPATGMVVADHDAYRRLPATIAIYRAAQAQGVGDTANAVKDAQRALEFTGADDHLERGAAAGFLALAHWRNGDLEIAYRHWVDTMESLRRAGHAVDALGCIRPLAEIRIAQGRLRDAMDLYEQGLKLATGQGAPVLRGGADMHVGMSGILMQWNELDAARHHLRISDELGDHAGLPLNPYRWHVAMASIRRAEGQYQGALEFLDQAERLYVGEFYPDTRPAAALRAVIWGDQGRLADATAWVSERALSVDDDLSYVREYEHITLARILMASQQGDTDKSTLDAIALLGRLESAAQAGGRVRSLIEVLVLRALAHQQLGSAAASLASLERALTLAESEGYVRIFVDEGAPMAALLSTIARLGHGSGYTTRLLAASRDSGAPRKPAQPLVDPLSARELDVLRLLATELDGPGIARELVVGVSTVRSHTKSIYAKLAVNNRRAAVRRAEELGLLSRARSA